MRPDILNPLFSPVSRLAGVGPRVGQMLSKLLTRIDPDAEPRVLDLLFHLPFAVIDRSLQPAIEAAPTGSVVTLEVTVDRHQPPPRGNRRVPYRVTCHDDTGTITLTFFHAKGDWLQRSLPVGSKRFVSGKVEWFNGRASMVHPDHIVDAADFGSMPLIEPVYPMTAGLARKTLLKAIGEALTLVPELEEWLSEPTIADRAFPTFNAALRAMHHPASAEDLRPHASPRARLAYDELLASQLAIALVRDHQKRAGGEVRRAEGVLRQRILDALPFTLTESQVAALADIEADMARPERMLRLLQGDVGAGKTVVALLAAATVIESGAQTALMAPTELLARQHAQSVSEAAAAARITVAVLTGREKGAERETLLADLEHGAIDLLIGTHALFQSAVTFKNLGLVVVDEQHRFGVHQRLALTTKGRATDVLVMTATPIPRTLVLTYYGDMDVSRLTEKPAGRLPIETRAMPLDRLGDVVDRVRAAVETGAKAYWICPLVEDSDESDLVSAEARHAALTKTLGPVVGLIHGRMRADERDRIMRAFRDGDLSVLVSTTVVEVGVDVRDATIMIVEHAERFGLAQLHQLRGRVGRGEKRSTCLLLYKAPLGEVARERLSILRDSEDGFRIAENDLRLRGGGEVLGTRQSGLPGFVVALPEAHADLMEAAHREALAIVTDDPGLSSPRGQALRALLYLFGRDAAIRLLRAG